ncbi:MAG: hypothetical protein ACRCWF_05530 [Beijerinckiaceae bacterium]
MGKRSHFERLPRDFYPTPIEAVLPLLSHLGPCVHFSEPCAGNGALVDHLEAHGHLCVWQSDIEPQRSMMAADALSLKYVNGIIITNPPWDRKILHPMIRCFAEQRPTWLLFDADWVHTRQSAPFIPMLRKIVSVGRVKWIPDSKMTGKDNCAWHLFDVYDSGPIEFVGRV